MAHRPPDLRRGRIVWAEVVDPRGNAKRRPALILTPTETIRDDEPLIVMAITTTYPDPAPDDHVELPWTNRGHPITKLNRRSAAVVPWLDEIRSEGIVGFGGDVPAKQMREIETKLGKLD